MMGKSAFLSEGTAGQMKSAPSFSKDDDSTLPRKQDRARTEAYLGEAYLGNVGLDGSAPGALAKPQPMKYSAQKSPLKKRTARGLATFEGLQTRLSDGLYSLDDA
jgi:hypothetical protein